MPRKRSRRTAAQSDPRVVGGRYLSGYWRQEYTVTAMETRDGVLWLTCQWHPWTPASDPRVSPQWAEPGSDHVTRHCTPWDARRDSVISLPASPDQGLPAMRALITVLAYLGMIAIPAVTYAGVISLSYIGTWGLAGAWAALLWAGIAAGGETSSGRPEHHHLRYTDHDQETP